MLGISERSKIESIVVDGKGNRPDPTDVGWGDGGGGLLVPQMGSCATMGTCPTMGYLCHHGLLVRSNCCMLLEDPCLVLKSLLDQFGWPCMMHLATG